MSHQEKFSPGWLSTEKATIEPSLNSKSLGVVNAVISFTDDIYSRVLRLSGLENGKRGPRFPGAVDGRIGGHFAAYQSYYGAPASVMMLEKLIASGIRNIVAVGEAGSLSPSVRIGDIVIPRWGIREEGTSYHYIPADVVPMASEKLANILKAALGGTKCTEGGVWTTDAPYRETRGRVREYSGRGAVAVEMECAALMSVSMYRKAEFAAVLVITDELFAGEWKEGFDCDATGTARERAAKAAVAAFTEDSP
jgi:nucleoside phosphorylase